MNANSEGWKTPKQFSSVRNYCGPQALRNAFRRGKAQKIEAGITYGDSEFLLHVRDDGSGIDPAVADLGARAGHWGLPGMRERAKRFGGKL